MIKFLDIYFGIGYKETLHFYYFLAIFHFKLSGIIGSLTANQMKGRGGNAETKKEDAIHATTDCWRTGKSRIG